MARVPRAPLEISRLAEDRRSITKAQGVAGGGMAQRQPTLGECPDCEAAVPEGALLIRYRRNGWPAVFAECPDCGGVVRPT